LLRGWDGVRVCIALIPSCPLPQAIEAWYNRTHPTAAALCDMLHRVEAVLHAFSALETASPTFIHRPVADEDLAVRARGRARVCVCI
jgi:hypothetical protein